MDKSLNNSRLRAELERLHDRYNAFDFIENDPISIPHRYSARGDREISGFLAATIAWGNRKMILRSAGRMMELMDNAPHDFVLHASPKDLERFDGFAHRTFNGADLRGFVLSLRRFEEQHGGLGAFFESHWAANGDMRRVLAEFRAEFLQEDTSFCAPRGKHISNIERGAACKRLNMFLRWMVRRDDRGVDFGLWQGIPMSALYLPLDVHSGRVAREFGLLQRRQDDWRAVEEVTARLRELDAEDPVKYDFALFGMGVNRVSF